MDASRADPEVASPEKLPSSAYRHDLSSPLPSTHLYVALLICCFISGLTDAAAFAAWSTFLSMQTGNTVFLALGASGQPTSPPVTWLKSLTSIVFFILGCFLFPRAMRAGTRKAASRGSMAGSFGLQAACISIAGGLVQGGVTPVPAGLVTPVDEDPQDPRYIELVSIALLAFQAGGQIVASRVLGYSEIPTTVMTSAYCDLVGDERLFKRGNGKRDRRAIGALLLLIGAIVGGWVSRSEGGMGAVLWTAGSLKATLALVWLFWKGEAAAV